MQTSSPNNGESRLARLRELAKSVAAIRVTCVSKTHPPRSSLAATSRDDNVVVALFPLPRQRRNPLPVFPARGSFTRSPCLFLTTSWRSGSFDIDARVPGVVPRTPLHSRIEGFERALQVICGAPRCARRTVRAPALIPRVCVRSVLMHYEGAGARSFTEDPLPCDREREEIPRGIKRHELIFDKISKREKITKNSIGFKWIELF